MLRKQFLLTNLQQYLLKDTFSDTVVAGSLNATQARPVGGKRTITDTNSKISTSNATFSLATGAAVNSGIWWPSQTRVIGRMFLAQINTNGVANTGIGLTTAQSSATQECLRFGATGVLSSVRDSTATTVGLYTNSINYTIALIMRSSGVYSFIKGGTEYINWTMLYNDTNRNANMFPGIFTQTGTTIVLSANNIRVPKNTWLPTPSTYDTFTRSNGALGNTEGIGPDTQDSPVWPWTSTAGTWAVASNAAAASALAGGLAFATVNPLKSDIIIDCNLTRSAGVVGIVLRYSNSNNYIIAYHDGTNAKLDKVIAGVTTNVLSAVQAYSAGATLRVIAYGSSFRLFYNNVAIGGVGTISDAAVQTTTIHGMYTTDTGATFDNFTIFPRGTANEYSFLNNF